MIVYEFKVEGMTCVACSSSIERGLTKKYQDMGLVLDENMESNGVKVVLLMHKMRISFYKHLAEEHKVTVQHIVEAVENIGFEAVFLNKFEIGASELGSQRSSRRGEAMTIQETTFTVRGMTCASCTGSVERHFSKLDGVLSISVSLLT